MLRPIFGSKSGEQVLAFLVTHPEGYATEIAGSIGVDLYAVQKQLEKFERAGILLSKIAGRKRIYALNPGYPLQRELKSLIRKALSLQQQPRPGRSHARLPESLRAFFWDYRFDQLSWKTDHELIIRRLLMNGSWDAITWLRRQTGDDGLRKWLTAHRGRGLSPRQLRFWSLVLDLPGRQVDVWARQAKAGAWNQR